jgi:hypothetical protein
VADTHELGAGPISNLGIGSQHCTSTLNIPGHGSAGSRSTLPRRAAQTYDIALATIGAIWGTCVARPHRRHYYFHGRPEIWDLPPTPTRS